MTEQEEKEQQQDDATEEGAGKIKLPLDNEGEKPEKPHEPEEVERSFAPPPGPCPNCGARTYAGMCNCTKNGGMV